MRTADIGVFGGSGFYAFLDDPEEIVVDTPYGKPAAAVTVGSIEERRVAFIPRHGKDHEFPPHRVPYRANVWAMKKLGVAWVISVSAVEQTACIASRLQAIPCNPSLRTSRTLNTTVPTPAPSCTKNTGPCLFIASPKPALTIPAV